MGYRVYKNGLTIKQLKEFINDLSPESLVNFDDEDTEVWVETANGLSSPVTAIWQLNFQVNEEGKVSFDILLTSETPLPNKTPQIQKEPKQ